MPPDQDIDLTGLRPENEIAGREPRNPCDVERVLGSLPEDQKDTFLSLIFDRSLNASRLARQLRDRNIYISDATIGRHQRRDCMRCSYYDRG